MPNKFTLFALGKCITLSIFILFLGLFFHCDFQKPAAPSFESNLNVPLIAKTYYMDELVDDTDYIKSTENGDLFFEVARDIARIEVGENLKISPVSQKLDTRLGSFKINPPGSKSTFITLEEVSSNISQFHGQQTIVDPFEMTPPPKNLEPFPNYEWVTIDSGFAEVTVANNLAFYIGSPLYIVITETRSGNEVTRSQIDNEIAPGASESVTLDLGGKTIPNELDVRISGHCAGSKGIMVPIDAQSSLQIDVSLSEFIVSAALAKVPEQKIANTDNIAIGDSIIIKEAKIEKGKITLRISGDFPVKSCLTYKLPDFYDQSNQILEKTLWVSPSEDAFEDIDLSGYSLKPHYNSSELQSIRFEWRFRTQDTGENFVELSSDDNMFAFVDMTELRFESVTGILSALKVNFEPVEEELDMPTEIDSLLLSDAELELNLRNGINFPATSDLVISGRNEKGVEVPLYVHEKINAAPYPGEIESTRIILNEQNSDIVPFLNGLPNALNIGGRVILGENQWEGTIHKNDYIEGSIRIRSSLALALPHQVVETDVDEIDLDEDIREKVEDHFLEGELWGGVENRLPIATNLSIMFGFVDSLVYSEPELSIGPIAVKPSAFSPATGYSEEAVISKIKAALDSEELKIFKHDPLYIGLLVELPGTDGQIVRVTLSDFLKVQLALKLRVRIGPTD